MGAFEEQKFSLQNNFSLSNLRTEIDNNSWAIFENKILEPPKIDESVLGDSDINTDLVATSSKWISVDLTTQTLRAFENDKLVFQYLISSGKWDRTPIGTYYIWTKIRSQKMSGGSKEDGTYYYLPNVPYIMFYYNDKIAKKTGYSLHGTYWHNNFGTPMSHGCVNMKTEEIAKLYAWAEVGTKIDIYGKYDPKYKN